MVDDHTRRKLVAILAADVVGYSRLMGADEEATLGQLKSCREIIDPLIGIHKGRIFGGAGDSIIAEFASPVEAVRCATEIQLAIDKHGANDPNDQRMRFRIGINLGDVIVDGSDLMGDSVNIAARLESLAPPGGVCVSEAVLGQVRNRLDLDFLDLGEHAVKNIDRPVRAYRVPLVSEEQKSNPYRGLATFEFEHVNLFFGRAAAVTATKERLEQQANAGSAFLLIYGMSGAGKSSLLRAGLMPALFTSDANCGIELWRYCVIRPSDGASPIDALVRGLISEAALPELAESVSVSELVDLITADAGKAQNLVRSALGSAAKASHVNAKFVRLIIAVDQMEELFTAATIDSASRIAFIDVIAPLARSGLVWVVGTIRSDFFYRCGEVEGFSELKDGLGSYELLPPTGPEIAQMIREPARTAGFRFEDDPQEGNLADVLQQSAAQQPGSLPLLGFVLEALYETGRDRRQMTFGAYRALGGLEGAIARRADEVVASLPSKVQAALPAVISALTTIRQHDDAVTSRAIPRAEVAADDDQNALVDALLEARLLTSTEGPDGAAMIRIAHEALLSKWPSAQDIVAANREFLATRSRVRSDARRWLAEDRSVDFLLPSGKRLAEAEEMLTLRRDELNDNLIDYVEASVSAQDAREFAEQEAEAERARLEIESAQRLAHRTRIAAIVTLVLAIIAGTGAIIGFNGQNEAERLAEIAKQNADQARTAEQESARQAKVAEQNALEARNAEQEAERQARAAVAARDQALRNQSVYLTDLSRQQTALGNATNGILLAMEALPADMSNPNRPYVIDAEAALYDAISAHREIAVLSDHKGGILHVSYSQDGKKLVSTSDDKTARIWDVGAGTEKAVLNGHNGAVYFATFSPDGLRVATASADKTARLWDANTGSELAVLEGHEETVRQVRFSPDGRTILTVSDDGTALLWEAANATKIGELAGHTDVINAIVFSDDNRLIATASADKTARIWDASRGTEIAVMDGHNSNVRDVAFSPDSKMLATASDDETARLWELNSDREAIVLSDHELGVSSVAFSPDGALIATASFDDTARLWDVNDGTLISILEGHERSITSIAFSAGGEYLVTASSDGTARLWNTFDGAELSVLRGHTQVIEHIASSPTKNHSATASADGTIRIWNTGIHLDRALVVRHDGGVASAEFSPSGTLLLTAAYDGTARLWDAADGANVATMGGHSDEVGIPNAPVVTAVFSPDEQRVVTVAPDGNARLWDTETGAEIYVLQGDYATPVDGRDAELMNVASFNSDGSRVVVAAGQTAGIWNVSSGKLISELQGHSRHIDDVAFSPDGRHIITNSYDRTARIWDAETGAEKVVLAGHDLAVTGAYFSPDSRMVLTVSQDATARLWDVASGSEIAVLEGHRQNVSHGAFSPDGTRIATTSTDRTAMIWTVDGEVLAVMRGHDGPIYQATFSPNGSRIATASADFTARVWDANTGSQVTVLKGHEGFVNSVKFSRNGNRVTTSSNDHTARIFGMYQSTQDLIDYARTIVPRKLSLCERKRFFLSVGEDIKNCPN